MPCHIYNYRGLLLRPQIVTPRQRRPSLFLVPVVGAMTREVVCICLGKTKTYLVNTVSNRSSESNTCMQHIKTCAFNDSIRRSELQLFNAARLQLLFVSCKVVAPRLREAKPTLGSTGVCDDYGVWGEIQINEPFDGCGHSTKPWVFLP